MGKYKVVEKFVSINGEGQAAGELSCFIRFAGCNLSCGYCDTKWANEKDAPYEILSEEEIYGFIKESGVRNVTITGGEPLIQENIGRLLKMLAKDGGLRTEIETNGSVSIKDYKEIGENIVFTLDYKLPASGMQKYMLTDNYRYISKNDTVKFVVSNRYDLDTARSIIEEYGLCDKTKVYLSPVFGSICASNIVDYMIRYNMNKTRLQLQLHKYIWDPDKKGV